MFVKLLTLLGLCCLLVACGGTAANGNPGSNEVHMNATQFVQTSITINKGQSITLVNDEMFTPHIIANGTWEGSAAKPGMEPGAPTIKNIQINGSSSQSAGPFATAGTFKLYCTIHPGMKLTVIVQ